MVPRVSVLMSVFNGERSVRNAVDSILAQTFTDFEFIIVDDGSIDRTPRILDEYNDPRIVRLTNRTNLGLPASLNRGLRMARGEFLARMDADDWSVRERLERQVTFMDDNPALGLLGTQVWDVDADGHEYVTEYPQGDIELRWELLFQNAFWHPSVMVRLAILRQVGDYSTDHACSQDYELWARMMRVCHIANLPEPFVRYRRGDKESITVKWSERQLENAKWVSNNLIRQTLGGVALNEKRMDGLRSFHRGCFDFGEDVRVVASDWLALWRSFCHSNKAIRSQRSNAFHRLEQTVEKQLIDCAWRWAISDLGPDAWQASGELVLWSLRNWPKPLRSRRGVKILVMHAIARQLPVRMNQWNR